MVARRVAQGVTDRDPTRRPQSSLSPVTRTQFVGDGLAYELGEALPLGAGVPWIVTVTLPS